MYKQEKEPLILCWSSGWERECDYLFVVPCRRRYVRYEQKTPWLVFCSNISVYWFQRSCRIKSWNQIAMRLTHRMDCSTMELLFLSLRQGIRLAQLNLHTACSVTVQYQIIIHFRFIVTFFLSRCDYIPLEVIRHTMEQNCWNSTQLTKTLEKKWPRQKQFRT